VAYGYVGNKIATFTLQRLGIEVIPIFTVQFSNHTGYGHWTGQANPPQHIDDMLEGLDQLNQLPNIDAVISGYLGEVTLGEKILATTKALSKHNPNLLYCCDPVMGDKNGCFVKPGITEFFRQHAVPSANIITPNAYELSTLAGQPINNIDDARLASEKIRRQGPSTIITTSIEDENPEKIYMLLDTKTHSWLIEQTKQEALCAISGAGDLTTALFTGQYLHTQDPVQAFEHTANALTDIITLTKEHQSNELMIIAGQHSIAQPSSTLKATCIRDNAGA
jgi:pyridoxine kinase